MYVYVTARWKFNTALWCSHIHCLQTKSIHIIFHAHCMHNGRQQTSPHPFPYYVMPARTSGGVRDSDQISYAHCTNGIATESEDRNAMLKLNSDATIAFCLSLIYSLYIHIVLYAVPNMHAHRSSNGSFNRFVFRCDAVHKIHLLRFAIRFGAFNSTDNLCKMFMVYYWISTKLILTRTI